jgi:tetratricopeptide (TPR) repeat protein
MSVMLPAISSAMSAMLWMTGSKLTVKENFMNTAEIIHQGNRELKTLQFTKAENTFQKALKADSRSAGARIGLGRVLLLKGASKEAESLFEEVLKLAPQNAEALALKGVLCMKNRDWKQASLYLEKAMQVDPNLEMVYVNLAKSHRKLGDLKAAEEASRKAIRLNDKNHLSHVELGAVLMKTKRLKAGIHEMITALRINPLYVPAYLLLGRMYQVAGKIDLAVRIYERGLKHNPIAIPLREELAAALAFQGDFHTAYRHAVLIAIHRGSDQDWLRVGNLALSIGHFEKAEKAFQKALEKNGKSWEAHYNLAELYSTAKLFRKAKENYLLAIEKDGKSFKPFNGIGWQLMVIEKNSVEAQKYFLRALELEPNRKEPLLNLALSCADLKQNEDARKIAEATLRFARKGDGIYEQAERLIAEVSR